MAGLLLALTACKKTDVIPGNGQDACINFYNASEIQQQNILLGINNWIIINPLPAQFPAAFHADGDNRQFPFTAGISDVTPDNLALPFYITYNNIYWLPVMAGTYRFAYTSDSAYAVLKDTTATLQPKTFTTQYMVESPAADSLYSIFTIPVQRAGTPGKVRVQIVHLSPDFGPADVYRADSAGNRLTTNLPTGLTYGNNSGYVEIDTAGAAITKGVIVLKFLKSGSNTVAVTSVLPAVSNSSFIVMFQGFWATTVRRIKTRNGYQSVTVNPNIRTNLRRVF